MLYYLDSVVVIRAVEGNPAEQGAALSHLRALEAAGHRFAVSDLTRAECLVPVFSPGSGERLSDFLRFFHSSNMRTIGMSTAVFDRASAIRGGFAYPATPPALPRRYGLADALHLSAAIEAGCDVFLTADARLAGFMGIRVELLP